MPTKPDQNKKPRRAYLTDRHGQVLQALQTYGLLRERTIHTLYFSAIAERRNVHDKLERYRQQGYVGRKAKLYFPPSSESFNFVHQDRVDHLYYLGEQGAPLIGATYDRRYKEMGITHIYHRADIQEVRICLELALQGTPQTKLVRWYNEFERDEDGDFILHEHVETADPETGRKLKLPLYPDAAFILKDEETGKEDFFFLEVDEGREDLADRWKKKVLAYRAYGHAFKEDWQLKGFRVLTVNRSQTGKQPEKRKTNLIAATYRNGGRKQFCFATFNELMPGDQVTGAHFLSAPIWQRAEADDAGACPAIKLTDYLFDRDRPGA